MKLKKQHAQGHKGRFRDHKELGIPRLLDQGLLGGAHGQGFCPVPQRKPSAEWREGPGLEAEMPV